MTRGRKLAVFALVVLFGASAVAVQAQDTPASRGTLKVRPRFFNPFVSPALSRITVNPFGVISFSQPTAASAAAASTVAAASSAASASSGDAGVSAGTLRPPFNPGVRSFFRPPPSPPF